MKQIVPFVIVGASFVFFLAMSRIKPAEEKRPGLLKRIWRKIVAVFDFLSNFG